MASSASIVFHEVESVEMDNIKDTKGSVKGRVIVIHQSSGERIEISLYEKKKATEDIAA